MKKLTILLGLAAILFSQTALAQVDADELKALREQVRILTQRLDDLEKANQQTTQNVASPPHKRTKQSTKGSTRLSLSRSMSGWRRFPGPNASA